MGIIAKQSFYNSISIGLAFLIGAINTVYLYPTHMGSALQGLVVALLALSNLIQPFISFGVQHAVIKFYSSCNTKEERDKLYVLSVPCLFDAIVREKSCMLTTAKSLRVTLVKTEVGKAWKRLSSSESSENSMLRLNNAPDGKVKEKGIIYCNSYLVPSPKSQLRTHSVRSAATQVEIGNAPFALIHLANP